MDDVGVKDTAAYRIVRQIIDHTWGPDEKIDEEEFVRIYQTFCNSGGSWAQLMDGDMASVRVLEESIDGFLDGRKVAGVAARIAARVYPR